MGTCEQLYDFRNTCTDHKKYHEARNQNRHPREQFRKAKSHFSTPLYHATWSFIRQNVFQARPCLVRCRLLVPVRNLPSMSLPKGLGLGFPRIRRKAAL
jgi:hypothetical protein